MSSVVIDNTTNEMNALYFKHNACFMHNINPIINKYISQPVSPKLIYKIERELNYYMNIYLMKQNKPYAGWELRVFDSSGRGDIKIDLINPFNSPDYTIFTTNDCSKCKEDRLKSLLK